MGTFFFPTVSVFFQWEHGNQLHVQLHCVQRPLDDDDDCP